MLKLRTVMLWAVLLFLASLSVSVTAQPVIPRAKVINEEGGTQFVSGQVNYTFPFFRLFLPDPFVIFYDIAGLVERDVDFVPDQGSQAFGFIIGDPFSSPFDYELSLPAVPRGQRRDLARGGVPSDDSGVMIFMVAVTSNTWSNPFMERRDTFVAGIMSSVVISTDIDSFLELKRGKLIVYAPDDQQAFPSGFGADGILFTDDDPLVLLPAGYTVVDISTEPFIFDRSASPVVDLIESENAELADFSDLGYVEAFDEMIALLRRRYAFTEYKGVDWDALNAEFRPRIIEAEQNRDSMGFRRALRQLAWRIPDGHVSGPFDASEFQRESSGGLGFVLRQLDDGRVLVTRVIPDLPAQRQGIQVRAEILEINGLPIEQALEQVVPWTSPFSTPHNLRLEQLRFVHRAPINTPITITYRNPGEQVQSARLITEFDPQSFTESASSPRPVPGQLPVEFRILDNGMAYIALYSFADDLPLMVRLWERAITQISRDNVPGLIIDLRRNGGGSGFLGDQLPAYFFDEELLLGNVARYSASRDEFVVNPLLEDRFILPESGLYYGGNIAVIVSPDCASACEAFAFAMTIENRAAIVGHYPTAGLGGSVVPIAMPENATFSYTTSRTLGPDGEINIEGIGVAPTVRVPVNEDTLFTSRDVLLEAAVDYLLRARDNVQVQQQGSINVGDVVRQAVQRGERYRYSLSVRRGQVINIIASDADGNRLNTVTRLYAVGNPEALLENVNLSPDDLRSGFQALEIPADLTIIIEIGTVNDSLSGVFELRIEEVTRNE